MVEEYEKAEPVEKTKPASTEKLSSSGMSAMRGETSPVPDASPTAPPVDETNPKEVKINWTGYPDGPKPDGPFRLVEGEEYETKRNQANAVNAKIHNENPDLDGLEIHEVKPVKFGGSPHAMDNKIFITPEEHMEYTRFWNNELRRLKEKGNG